MLAVIHSGYKMYPKTLVDIFAKDRINVQGLLVFTFVSLSCISASTKTVESSTP